MSAARAFRQIGVCQILAAGRPRLWARQNLLDLCKTCKTPCPFSVLITSRLDETHSHMINRKRHMLYTDLHTTAVLGRRTITIKCHMSIPTFTHFTRILDRRLHNCQCMQTALQRCRMALRPERERVEPRFDSNLELVYSRELSRTLASRVLACIARILATPHARMTTGGGAQPSHSPRPESVA